jgi:hypothetical protein
MQITGDGIFFAVRRGTGDAPPRLGAGEHVIGSTPVLQRLGKPSGNLAIARLSLAKP